MWPVQPHRPACCISEPASALISPTVCRSSLECPAWPDAASGAQHSDCSSSRSSSHSSGTSPSSGPHSPSVQWAAQYLTHPVRRSSIDLAAAAQSRPLQRSSVDLTPRAVRAWRRPSCEVGPRELVLRHNFKRASRSNSSGAGDGQQAAMDAAVHSHGASVPQRGQAWVQLQAATLRALQHAVSWKAGRLAARLHACCSLRTACGCTWGAAAPGCRLICLSVHATSSHCCKLAEKAVAGAQPQSPSAAMCAVASAIQASGATQVGSQ